jgi:hypothetical protein
MPTLHRQIKRLLLLAIVLFSAACSIAPTPTPTPTLPPAPTATEIPQALIDEAESFCPLPRNWTIYVTQPGDTFRSLAERTASSIGQLALANCLQNPRLLLSGVVIYLPRKPVTP